MFNFRKALLCAVVCSLFLFLFAGLAHAEGNGIGIVNGDGLNVRKSPNTSSQIIDQLSKGTQVSILSSSDGWYKIAYGKLSGWVSNDYLTVKQTASKSGTILADDVNLRSSPSTDAEVLTKLDKGAKVSVSSSSGDWYKISTSSGKVGWIFRDFISVSGSVSRGSGEVATRTTKTASVKNTGTTGQKIVAYAKEFLGVKYVYGGSSPKGFDCSGFSKYVYSGFGVSLERVAADQATHGTKVSKANLKSGDLVFFDTNGGHNYVNHVGIYVGDGKFIHASSGQSNQKVVISDLNEGFYLDSFMAARRMLN